MKMDQYLQLEVRTSRYINFVNYDRFGFMMMIKSKLYTSMNQQNCTISNHYASNTLGHANRVFSIKFIKDQPNIFISGGWDGNVLIWDLRDRKA